MITLTASTSGIVPEGTLTLAAKTGVYITDNMKGEATNKALVINADADSHYSSTPVPSPNISTGTLTVASTKTVTSNDSDVTITAWDVDMSGSLTAGTKSISIHGSYASQTIGVGATSKDMQISDGAVSYTHLTLPTTPYV